MPKIIIGSDSMDTGLVYVKVEAKKGEDGKPFRAEQYIKRDVETDVCPELLAQLRTSTVVRPVKTAEGKTTHKEFPTYAITVVSND